jgi:hypothetical protein
MAIKEIVIEAGAVVMLFMTTLIGVLTMANTAAKKLDATVKSIKKLLPGPRHQPLNPTMDLIAGGAGKRPGFNWKKYALLAGGLIGVTCFCYLLNLEGERTEAPKMVDVVRIGMLAVMPMFITTIVVTTLIQMRLNRQADAIRAIAVILVAQIRRDGTKPPDLTLGLK